MRHHPTDEHPLVRRRRPQLLCSEDTALVEDILPGPEASAPVFLTELGGKVLFAADDGARGQELWATDGSAPGTEIVLDIREGPASSVPSGP